MISVIVPCFNEEETIHYFYQAMEKVRIKMNEEFEYIFVNDGSKDSTLSILRSLSVQDRSVSYLSFSRNFGKEAALFAGLEVANGHLVTVMDADLQDPPEMLMEMKQMLDDNSDLDCVGTRRVSRDGEPLIRSFFATLFYKLMNKISQVEVVDGARDFRLMRRHMVDAILSVSEYNRFSKGLFSWVGFNTEYLPYKNVERVAGETSWSLWKLLSYSIEGIINFSDTPLNIASYTGFFTFLLSLVLMVFVVIKTLVFGDPTIGWPSTICIILFLGGLQLMTIGILGKYLAKIFLETKKRPIYIVKERSSN
ncbi:TPA: glycosyltransferase family 2 protein [Streptococcus suis]|uniref:glycosyltransferase family 2 protein n=1 Tax=Streptococcus parasuis TaxID=1501662 RepID=UPI001568AF43|nr:glycosyltransferase family 2 protein [Streptococcus parasuis]MDG4499147.1 glycosyltransferase family 2 protein [Streptococcus suis]QWV86770.1 glycosyltransferase family 2 protein [Streptococcus parasuis]WDN57682.1 glycosyltransferase family 2 protein [Streptococcus parasuis]WDN59500.1 glycosyltransferase family 2 protein [Streptococcus parasuis]WFB91111.1 glycosyltransferase family 2 protein [Streptococcus parasuis]